MSLSKQQLTAIEDGTDWDVTDEQIEELRREALLAGDEVMASRCSIALGEAEPVDADVSAALVTAARRNCRDTITSAHFAAEKD